MVDLDFDARATLELIASRGEHVVFDGSLLCDLHRQGLVEMSMEGWDVTVLGRYVVETANDAV